MNSLTMNNISIFVYFTVMLPLLGIPLYKLYVKPLRRIEDYYNRILAYYMIRLYSKAIKIGEKALTMEINEPQKKADLLFIIGDSYFKSRDYLNARKYFDQGLKIISNENFMYREVLQNVIKTFVYTSDTMGALRLYENFLSRAGYDKHFTDIKQLDVFLRSYKK